MTYFVAALSAALALVTASSANASLIQIEFRGAVTSATDLNGNVFSSSVSLGATATGRIVFRESLLAGLTTDSTSDGIGLQSVTAGLNKPSTWISSELYIDGQTFRVNDYPSTPPQNAPVNSSYNITSDGWIGTRDNYAGHDWAAITESSSATYRIPYSMGSAQYSSSSAFQIWGESLDMATTTSNDIFDVNTLGLLRNFVWFDAQHFSQAFSGSGYIHRAEIFGNITSLTLTRIDQPSGSIPEPSSMPLLLIGLLGLAAQSAAVVNKSKT